METKTENVSCKCSAAQGGKCPCGDNCACGPDCNCCPKAKSGGAKKSSCCASCGAQCKCGDTCSCGTGAEKKAGCKCGE